MSRSQTIKKYSTGLLWLLALGVFLITLSTSGCTTLVIKKDAAKIKRVAFASISVNKNVTYLEKGKSSMNLMSLARAVGQAGGSEEMQTADQIDYPKLVRGFAEDLQQAFGKISGWKVIPVSDYVETEAFKEFHDGLTKTNIESVDKAIGVLAERLSPYETYPGMPYIEAARIGRCNESCEGKRACATICRASVSVIGQHAKNLIKGIGADAVIVVDAELHYDDATAIMGTGTANAKIVYHVAVIGRSGEPIVWQRESFDAESDRSVKMAVKQIKLDRDFEQALSQGLKNTAEEFVTVLIEDLESL